MICSSGRLSRLCFLNFFACFAIKEKKKELMQIPEITAKAGKRRRKERGAD